jgi:hypothetical protein
MLRASFSNFATTEFPQEFWQTLDLAVGNFVYNVSTNQVQFDWNTTVSYTQLDPIMIESNGLESSLMNVAEIIEADQGSVQVNTLVGDTTTSACTRGFERRYCIQVAVSNGLGATLDDPLCLQQGCTTASALFPTHVIPATVSNPVAEPEVDVLNELLESLKSEQVFTSAYASTSEFTDLAKFDIPGLAPTTTDNSTYSAPSFTFDDIAAFVTKSGINIQGMNCSSFSDVNETLRQAIFKSLHVDMVDLDLGSIAIDQVICGSVIAEFTITVPGYNIVAAVATTQNSVEAILTHLRKRTEIMISLSHTTDPPNAAITASPKTPDLIYWMLQDLDPSTKAALTSIPIIQSSNSQATRIVLNRVVVDVFSPSSTLAIAAAVLSMVAAVGLIKYANHRCETNAAMPPKYSIIIPEEIKARLDTTELN